MALDRDTLKKVVALALMTRDEEINCDECLLDMAQFAETELAGRDVPEALAVVQHHLDLCGPCREEYRALLGALQQLNEGDAGAAQA